MLKNKKLLTIFGVIAAIVLLGGGYFLFAGNSTPEAEQAEEEEMVAQEISADEIGLTMDASPDGKKVKFAVEKAEGITSMEYEVTYEADSTAQERSEGGEPRVQRGITGEAAVKSGQSSYESEWLDLGSCSRNVCKYDSGVSEVNMTLKIVKEDGKTYLATQTLQL